MFTGAEVKVLELSTSDHMLLFLELNRLVYVKKARNSGLRTYGSGRKSVLYWFKIAGRKMERRV